MKDNITKNVLITGAGRRIGSAIAKLLHQEGMRIMIHYHHSEATAQQLCDELNASRVNSAVLVQADLSQLEAVEKLATDALNAWGSVDVLVNNASAFFQTDLAKTTSSDWDTLMNVNLKAPFFLTQALAPTLKDSRGCVVNIVDIHAEKPLKHYPIYSMTKAGLQMMTFALAMELAPDVRVNGVSPGTVALPEGVNKMSSALEAEILSRNMLKREGSPLDVAKAVLFFIQSADYITGQVLAVDGGRLLYC